jgi:hypothetical protein
MSGCIRADAEIASRRKDEICVGGERAAAVELDFPVIARRDIGAGYFRKTRPWGFAQCT